MRFNRRTHSIFKAGGGSGAVARENRGWEARQERAGRAGVQRGWESEEKCKMLIFVIYKALKYFRKQEAKMFFELQLAYSETFGLTSKWKFVLGLKMLRLVSGKIGNPFTVVTSHYSYVMKCRLSRQNTSVKGPSGPQGRRLS